MKLKIIAGKRAGDCKHYTGTLKETCDAGVNYRELAGAPAFGWGRRLPCLPSLDVSGLPEADHKVECAKFAPLTQAEADERDREIIELAESALGEMEKQ